MSVYPSGELPPSRGACSPGTEGGAVTIKERRPSEATRPPASRTGALASAVSLSQPRLSSQRLRQPVSAVARGCGPQGAGPSGWCVPEPVSFRGTRGRSHRGPRPALRAPHCPQPEVSRLKQIGASFAPKTRLQAGASLVGTEVGGAPCQHSVAGDSQARGHERRMVVARDVPRSRRCDGPDRRPQRWSQCSVLERLVLPAPPSLRPAPAPAVPTSV